MTLCKSCKCSAAILDLNLIVPIVFWRSFPLDYVDLTFHIFHCTMTAAPSTDSESATAMAANDAATYNLISTISVSS
jgi:hypothetical protein